MFILAGLRPILFCKELLKPINFVFKVDGNKLTGTAQGDGDPVPIDSGKVTGNEFSFTSANPQGVVFKHSGKYLGDSISMNIDVNGTRLHATLKRDDK